MKKTLLILSITLFASLAAHAQLENPKFQESPFAEPAKLSDVPENARVYIVVKAARGEKTTESLIEIIKKKTTWTVVDSPKDADVAIQTAQTRRQGWRKEYGMQVYVRKGDATPLVWQNVRLNDLGDSAAENLIGAFIEDWNKARVSKKK
ncbi:MAG: hypothetical protein ABI791_12500 [Acidobacteriota bacterium]